VRLWRWRQNSLRRRSDVVEAWVIVVGWVFALVCGLLAGLMAADAVERDAERQREERRQVSAVPIEDAQDRMPQRAATDYRVWATEACRRRRVRAVWCWAVRLGLERRRIAQWAAEWERVDTRKGRKTG
jgi:hypothetical protein